MTNLQSIDDEIQQLKSDLASAEALRVRPEDVRANAIRQRLSDKQAELLATQLAEGLEISKQQRQMQLTLLAETGKEIDRVKAEVNTLRAMIAELPAKLAASEYQLNLLLRTHAQLKQELHS